MASPLIHYVSHGLLASDTIMLGNLVGGDGLEENTLYYVLAAGLTADDFAVSLSDGGAAVGFTTEITDGTVVRTDTYDVVADGVMDAPSALPAPADAPVLTSTVVSGIMRLFIEVPGYTEGNDRLRATEVQVTHNYDGVTPQWVAPLTIAMPTGSTNVSIPVFGATTYAARSRVQDVYGNFSDDWSPVAELTTDAGVDSLVPADLSITDGKIATDAVRANHIKAGEITANKLAATLLLASLIQTAASGRRIEMDVDGVRLYDTDESLLVRIPTNGDPVYIKGQVAADSLVSQTAATFRTAVSFDASSVSTLQNGIAAPSAAPTLVASVDSVALTSTPTGVSTAAGIAYDAGAASYWIAADPSTGYVAHEYAAISGVLIRSIAATDTLTTHTTTLGSTSHVSDSASSFGPGTSNTHFATDLTMPRDGRITKVSIYAAGLSGSCHAKVGIWDDVSGTGNSLRGSDEFTMSSGGALGLGDSDHYNVSLTSSLSVDSGDTIWAGFYRTDSGDALQFDRNDGSGKTTKAGDGTGGDGTGWATLYSSSKPNVYVTYEYDTGSVLETLPNIGIATDGTYIYTLDTSGVIWKYDRATLAYVSNSAVITTTGTKSKAGLFYDATAAVLVITTTTGTGAGVYPKFYCVTPSTLVASGTVYSAATGPTVSGSTDTIRGGARVGKDVGDSGTAAYWVSLSGTVYAYTFSGSTATNVSDRDFGTSATVLNGFTYDTVVFRGWAVATSTKVWKFSAWDFTTASTTLRVGYAWYDSVGTTHETALGSPRATLTIRRRERAQVTTPTIPTGDADAPDKVRIYTLAGGSDTLGTYWLQVTDNATSRYLTSYTGSGTHDGAGTAFPAGTPAQIASAGTGWTLKGDGTATLGLLATGGKLPTTTTYTSGSGTYTPPAGVAFVVAELVGGGGQGGGSTGSGTAGHGALGGPGGGGGYVRKVLTAAQLAAGTVSYAVGAGGSTGGAAAAGQAGAASTLSGTGWTTLSAGGGAGGSTNGDSTADRPGGDPGAGGTSTGGDINKSGTSGAFGVVWPAGVRYAQGLPGASHFGPGATPTAGNATGGSAGVAASANTGGGGTGSRNLANSTDRAGGAGGSGLIVITEYYVG